MGHDNVSTAASANGSNTFSIDSHLQESTQTLESSYTLQCASWCRDTPSSTWSAIPSCSGCEQNTGNINDESSSSSSGGGLSCSCAHWCRYSPADTWEHVPGCCGCGPGEQRRQWVHIALACIVLLVLCGTCGCVTCMCCFNIRRSQSASGGPFKQCMPPASAPPTSEANDAEQATAETVVTAPGRGKTGSVAGVSDLSGVASIIDQNVARFMSKINALVHGDESTSSQVAAMPAAGSQCLNKALMFHALVAAALLVLLWGCEFAVLLTGNTGSFALPLIGTCALIQSIIAHYVSTLPCRHRAHWNVVVVGNLVNVVIFVWMIWLIDGILSWHFGVWPLLVTIFAFVIGSATTGAAWLFRPLQQSSPPPQIPV